MSVTWMIEKGYFIIFVTFERLSELGEETNTIAPVTMKCHLDQLSRSLSYNFHANK